MNQREKREIAKMASRLVLIKHFGITLRSKLHQHG